MLVENQEEMEMGEEGVELFHPENLLASSKVSAEHKEVLIGSIRAMLKNADSQVEKMRRQKESLNAEIRKLYSSINKEAYHLHSIYVHEGTDNSGHYYVFIRDPATGKFKKFSDINVTEIETEDVWRDSLGEFNQRSAFCLYYVNDEIWR